MPYKVRITVESSEGWTVPYEFIDVQNVTMQYLLSDGKSGGLEEFARTILDYFHPSFDAQNTLARSISLDRPKLVCQT